MLLELIIYGLLPIGLVAALRGFGVVLMFAYIALLYQAQGDKAIANVMVYSFAIGVISIVFVIVTLPFRK